MDVEVGGTEVGGEDGSFWEDLDLRLLLEVVGVEVEGGRGLVGDEVESEGSSGGSW